MPQPMDAVASFAHLTTNLPNWISEIEKLSTHATQRHAEFAAEYARLLKGAITRPKRVKSPSVTSIHSTEEKSNKDADLSTPGAETTSQPLDFHEISPFEAGNKYLYAQARRKRKPTSSVRSGASGPQNFRSKQSVVIYYDALLQEQLDTMVKSIASARNHIRKGKMARSLQNGLKLPTFNRRFPEIYNSSSEDLNLPQMHSTKSLPIDTKAAIAQVKPKADDSCFYQADKQLESAQTLCETAAHQFLRDGDCKVELDSVKANFEAVLALAIDALPKLEAEKEAEAERESARTDSEATLCEQPSRGVTTSKLTPTMGPFTGLPSSNIGGVGTAAIEVDDDDDSSIDVDISKFRNARAASGRMGLRSASGF